MTKMPFGKHEGQTFEWIFFNDPGYARWMWENRIHLQSYHFEEVEGDEFRELYRRARSLGGTCRQCETNPITRMGITTMRNGKLGHVTLYCDQCEYMGGSIAAYHPPSMWVEACTMPKCEQKRIITMIKHRYIGHGKLTQKSMEEFFHNDDNFADAASGFFLSASA